MFQAKREIKEKLRNIGPKIEKNEDVNAKEGEDGEYLEQVPESLKTFEKKQYAKKDHKIQSINNIQIKPIQDQESHSIEETKQSANYNQSIMQQSQINDNSQIGLTKLNEGDISQSFLPIPKNQRSRQKSDLTQSICSSDSDMEEDNPSQYKQKAPLKSGDTINNESRISLKPQLRQQQTLKKRSTYIEIKNNNIVAQADDGGGRSVKKQRRGNIVMLDQKQQVWLKNWVQIMYYIGKMKKFMKQTVLFFRPQLLTKWQLNSIQDKSSHFSDLLAQHENADYVKQYSYQRFEKFISFKNYKKIKKFVINYFRLFINFYQRLNFYGEKLLVEIFEFLPIFNTLQSFYILWELIIFICALINLIYIPIEISFELERSGIFSIYFEYICVLVFSTDIFIRSNTQYYEQGTKIEIHRIILKKYIKQRLIIDILSIISLNKAVFQNRFTSLFFFLRIFYSTRIVDIFREQFLLRVHISGMISLVLLFTQAMYFCHIFSCSFLALGFYELKNNEGWLMHYELANLSKLEQYLHGYYFSVVTMTTIGYGDYSAQTNMEKIFMIAFMIVSCGIFGYTINSIGNILYDFKLKRDEFLQQLAQVNKYFKFYNTDVTLQRRARKYLEYTYNDSIQESNISITSLDSLSPFLQIEIRNDAYKKALIKNKIIKHFFSEQFIEALATKMKETILSPDQVIIEEGEPKEPCVYFVNSGDVNIFSSRNNTENMTKIRNLTNGDVFGIEEFFLEKYYVPFSVKSIGITSVLSFNLTDFQELLKKYPDQVEMYCFLKDSIKFNKDFSKLQLSCYSCAQYNHCVNDCPYLFYGTNPQKIIRNYLNDIDKYILTFKRIHDRPHYNSRLNNEDVRNKADQFFLDNQDELSYASYSGEESDQDSQNDKDKDNYQQKSVFSQNQSSIAPIEEKQVEKQGLKEEKLSIFQREKSNSISKQIQQYSTSSLKADQESFLPVHKIETDNLVYSNQNIPKSISNLPDMKDGILKSIHGQENLKQRYSIITDQNNLVIPHQDQQERKKQKSFTTINLIASPSDHEIKPQSNVNNLILNKSLGQNLTLQKSNNNISNSSRKLSIEQIVQEGSSFAVKQVSKRNIGRQISRESSKDQFEVRDRKSTKNLDYQQNVSFSRNYQSELDIFFRTLMTQNQSHGHNKVNFSDQVSQNQPFNLDTKELAHLFSNYHPNNPATMSRNARDAESRRGVIDFDIQPSSKHKQIGMADGQSKFHRLQSKKEMLSEIELDKIQNYTIYFPKYNIDNIIKQLQKQDINMNIKKLLNNQRNLQTQKLL